MPHKESDLSVLQNDSWSSGEVTGVELIQCLMGSGELPWITMPRHENGVSFAPDMADD